MEPCGSDFVIQSLEKKLSETASFTEEMSAQAMDL